MNRATHITIPPKMTCSSNLDCDPELDFGGGLTTGASLSASSSTSGAPAGGSQSGISPDGPSVDEGLGLGLILGLDDGAGLGGRA